MRARALAAAGLLLAGCTLGPDYRRPQVSTPPEFRGVVESQPAAETLADIRWWRLFQDETLQGLIRTALVESYDLQIAAARILDARSQVTVARSFQFPTVDARADGAYQRIEGERDLLQGEDTLSATGGFLFGFEIDFWGRFRRATEAARAELLASEAARRFVFTTLVSDVATAYFSLRELDLELDISRRTLAARLDSLRLVRLRAEGGVAAMIDVHQNEILVAQAATIIADTERLIEQTENALSVLLGRNPDAVPRGRPLDDQFAAPPLPVGVPSALLERRPDIQQAEAQLHAATARIGIARADYFPRVFLSASAAAGGLQVDGTKIGPQGIFAVGPSITLPIFNSGRVSANVDSAEARTQAALAQYRQVIVQAFREVADGLVEYRKRQEARAQQEALTVASRSTTRLANIRYRGGVTSYLEVLDSERELFDAELGLARSRRDELLAVVRIYRALGGGWQE
ncbi:MAG TPA: efflux transporter outer membrane subunit [Methylomirabilota bacterium]|jgi:multidrug efflux system outer membrane protein